MRPLHISIRYDLHDALRLQEMVWTDDYKLISQHESKVSVWQPNCRATNGPATLLPTPPNDWNLYMFATNDVPLASLWAVVSKDSDPSACLKCLCILSCWHLVSSNIRSVILCWLISVCYCADTVECKHTFIAPLQTVIIVICICTDRLLLSLIGLAYIVRK